MKLYLVHVGYYEQELGAYESHTNFFVVAENPLAAKRSVMQKEIFTRKKMHVDTIHEINAVDGYTIKTEPNAPANATIHTFGYDQVKALETK